ncbi:MAG TPA: hypothetical protein VKA43_17850 [Gammaproteobacteria bacterium]|nr:hypothetical protein [Gammaproteobacteria bacterium]
MSSKSLWTPLCAGLLFFSTVAVAQPRPAPPAPPAAPEDTVFFLSNAAPLPVFGGQQIDIVRGEGDVLGPVVKDKPYSARAITESTQTLADGNRIVQRNETRIFRDSQGRTRREQTLGGVGQWQTAGAPVTMITINDPVAGKSYVLEPVARTVREIGPFKVVIAHAQAGLAGTKAELEKVWTAGVPAPGAEAVTVIRTETGGRHEVRAFARGVAVSAPFAEATVGMYEPAEDLGEQVLEGLLVKGTRLTDTIPAGSVGNERAIDIVTERWYSEDIQAVVLHRFSDPRFGETVYRLVNVALGDPSAELFTVPDDYESTVIALDGGVVRVGENGVEMDARRVVIERDGADAE